ncbi:MAG: AI-2E family transporter [Acidimicrobiales bacterium]
MSPSSPEPTSPAGAALRKLSDGAWRLLVVALLVLVVGALLWKLRIIVLPVFIAVLVCSALAPLVAFLEDKGWRPALATMAVFFGFLGLVALAATIIVPPTINELEGLGDTIEEALVDIEDWLVDGPLGLERADVEEVTDDPGGRLAEVARSSGANIADSAVLVGETLAGAVIALVLTFLFLKDGRRFQAWSLAHLPRRHHDVVRASASRAFSALSGFLRGAALLGLLEGTTIGVTLWLVGAPLAAPVALLTFLAAFFPIVGAIVAGAVAVLVALAGQGLGAAVIVGVVAIVVQQLDGDLLAPMIYGRSLSLHPATILISLTAGGILGGIAGAFLAVPISGAVAGVAAELWDRHGERWLDDTDAVDAEDATST